MLNNWGCEWGEEEGVESSCDFSNCENKRLKCESETFRRQLKNKQTNQDFETSLILQKIETLRKLIKTNNRDSETTYQKIIETARQPIKKFARPLKFDKNFARLLVSEGLFAIPNNGHCVESVCISARSLIHPLVCHGLPIMKSLA